ncbi:hypothetical protein [Thermoproteus tenax]|uniref:Uncharacterized protein n=1 Tax=Thermoproteus tenax (strain ATCC 35583 / DSM 2078 / JCM 9277 / NBRC 100435 / Kra 1) TaxID=768679 RepID=G4RL14_THETK|nr:hypothetical protein [Thermoproteus tenax]CCC82259.1 conserved hypothetical protein [Thermoproteus tenax Kra 1]
MKIRYTLSDITIGEGPPRVTLVPPPPSEAEKWVGLGLAIAKWGYSVQILNLPTCREQTILKALKIARGVPVYLKYAHQVAFIGKGALLSPEAFCEENIRREAATNLRYLLDWRVCLSLNVRDAPVDVLGYLPEALEDLRAWLADKLGRRHLIDGAQ